LIAHQVDDFAAVMEDVSRNTSVMVVSLLFLSMVKALTAEPTAIHAATCAAPAIEGANIGD
jgi:hypothetical protein